MVMLEMESLVGKHTLDGVGRGNIGIEVYDSIEPCDSFSFRLDDHVYTAIEDPDDGWRSCMRKLVLGKTKEITTEFSPIEVLCKMNECEYHYSLQIINVKNGEIIIEVGTEHTDDWYPCFISMYNPIAIT